MPFQIVAKTARPSGEALGEAREFTGTLLRIGRGADSDLLLEAPEVQINHAVIQEVSGVYILRGLVADSTLVNDKPAQEVILTSKGTIRIGPFLLEFSRQTLKSPLRIEWKRLRETLPTGDQAEASATLVLQVSPVAAKPQPADPDATQKIDPITKPARDDPDKTMVIPPPK